MKIVELSATPVEVPRAKPMVGFGSSSPMTVSRFGIVRIATDTGIDGIGEISVNTDPDGAAQCGDVNALLRPVLLGADPFDIRALVAEMKAILPSSRPAIAGVEMALFDLVGKALEVPVFQLLGGRMRDSVPVAWPLGFGDPEAAAHEARVWTDRGIQTIKIKIGRPGTSMDGEMVAAVREAVGPQVHIRVDANEAYSSVDEAIRELALLEPYGLELIEQPLGRADLAGHAHLRSRSRIPLVLDESIREPADAISIIRAGAADVLCVYVSQAGGLLSALDAISIGAAAGLPSVIGSQCELGVGTAALAHLAVAAPAIAYESDITGHWRYDADVICESLDLDGGAVRPPKAAGLGVSLNEDRVERWTTDE